MKTKSTIRLSWTLPAALLIVAACGGPEDESTANVATELQKLELENGGFDESPELPAFGRDEFVTHDELAADPVVSDGEAEQQALGTMTRRVSFTAIWGKIVGDPSETDFTDWSGMATVSSGAIGRVRSIRFEGQDEVAPRADRQVVSWRSTTRPHNDGLILELLVPPSAQGEGIRLEAGGFQIDVSYADMDDYRERFTVGDNTVLIQAFVLEDDELCKTGAFRGRWESIGAGGVGIFFGRWMNADGTVDGHVLGRYGQTAAGDKIFALKIIGPTGDYRGRARGHYDSGDFIGQYNLQTGATGEVRGRYERSSTPGERGVFVGRWAHDTCP